MTADEFQSLLRATTNSWWKKRPTPGARFRQLLIFVWYTGGRPGEAVRLKWSDIDFERQVIVLLRHKTARTQREARPRLIALHPVVVRLLNWIKRLNQPGDLVFLTHRLTAWNKSSLAHRVKRARELVGIADDVTLYGVRHAFGTRAVINGGLDIKTVAELMGHTTTRITEHYLHLAGKPAHHAAAMLRVNARRPSG